MKCDGNTMQKKRIILIIFLQCNANFYLFFRIAFCFFAFRTLLFLFFSLFFFFFCMFYISEKYLFQAV